MGNKFLLLFFTLSAFFHLLRAHGSPTNPDSNHLTRRNLLRIPDPKSNIADPPSENEDADDEREAAAEAPTELENRKMGKHHSSDKSMAGGGVIIGGLVTATFAAVYCYIRVTRRKHTEILK